MRRIGREVLAEVGDGAGAGMVAVTGGSQYACLRIIDPSLVEGICIDAAPSLSRNVVAFDSPSRRLTSSKSPNRSPNPTCGADLRFCCVGVDDLSSCTSISNIRCLAGVRTNGFSRKVIETVRHNRGSGTLVLRYAVLASNIEIGPQTGELTNSDIHPIN